LILPTSRVLALVIPALNEAATIQRVVASASQYGQVIVVDDGSSDDTAALAQAAGAIVVRHAVNQGYDQALASGLQGALEQGFAFAITLDADGQHRADAIALALARLQAGADLVVGRRDRLQRISETVFSLVGRVLWGVHDPLCGLKGYRLSCLAQLQALRSYESVGTELTVLAARSGWRIAQIPVATVRRVGASKFGSGWRANRIIFRALLSGLTTRRRSPASPGAGPAQRRPL